MKTLIPSNIIHLYTTSEVPQGLKLSSHSDTLAKASNLLDEFYQTGEIENEQKYRNALDKVYTR